MSRALGKVHTTRRIGETCVTELVEPLVMRGLFDTPESAVMELAEDYALRQVQNYRGIVTGLENKYGMTYHQFNHYLQHRTTLLESDTLSPEQARSLGQAIMLEEEDTLEWKIAREMLQI
ncbi:MAG: hypothetical protein ISS49_03310 [Anaerolineae bacterium]|nr:hypothetical protein [Anaerolineae bacterium]